VRGGGEMAYLGPATTADGSEVVAAAGLEENDSRFDPSLLFSTVFMRDNRPFFFPGTSGPALAGADIVNY
jgi:hypothetical protein